MGSIGILYRLDSIPLIHPHTRGVNGQHPQAEEYEGRFIPTLVGSMKVNPSLGLSLEIHPRTRGVNVLVYLCVRVRVERFIPTLVGSMEVPTSSASASTIHPHTRGVNRFTPHRLVAKYDSSPHSWGQFIIQATPTKPIRFIPTLVGSMRRAASMATY